VKSERVRSFSVKQAADAAVRLHAAYTLLAWSNTKYKNVPLSHSEGWFD